MTYTDNVFTNTKDFFAATAEFLYANEEANALLIGLLEAKADAWVANIRANGDTVLVAGYLGLSPRNLVVSGSDVAAVEHLVRVLRENNVEPEGVVGNVHVARRCADLLCEKTKCEPVVRLQQLLYRCSKVIPPSGVAGSARLADESDFETLVNWRREFRVEALPHELPDREQLVKEANEAIIKKDTYMWMVNEEAVACAQVGRPTARTMAVRYVYTPKEHRKKGYGSAITALATQNILRSGKTYGVLFTDATNPISNKVYQKLGYELVSESLYLGFV